MKKKLLSLIAIILIISMIMGLAGCAQQPKQTTAAAAGLYKAGTYTGEGKGFNGTTKVEVVVTDKEITSVKVLSHNDTPGVSDLAIKDMPTKIVKAQSLAVDVISGATYSSNGILEATTKALEKAGANIEKLKTKTETAAKAKQKVEKSTDIVIIGAGGAGLAAAVTANQNGAKVIVVEKMPKVGGNTILSGGAYNAVDPSRQKPMGIEDSVDKHFQQTYEGGDKQGNQELVKVLVENAYPSLQWLESLGMQFKPEVFTVLGALWPRSHKPVDPVGTGFFNAYNKYIEAHKSDIELMLNTKATEIIMENGKAVGIKATSEDAELTIKAKAVILAAGGFGNNIEMRNQNNKSWPDLTKIKSTNHPGATGDGIVMAKAIGVNLVGMEHIQLLPMGDPKTGSLSGNIEQGVENRIFVNKDGNRFVDEGARRDVMTKALFEQKDTSMWVIVDKHSYATGNTVNNFNETIDDLVAAGRAYKADTLEDLAKQIGVDPANLVKAVWEFNKNVESKQKDAFGRTLYKDKIDTAPFYAGARVPTVHHTMGGVEINTDAQVKDTKGNVIPGLFAAGEVTGGIHGTNRLGGNALADITVFGRIAGANAAKAIK